MPSDRSATSLASPGHSAGAGERCGAGPPPPPGEPSRRNLRQRLRDVDVGRFAVYVGFLLTLLVFAVTLGDEGFTSSRNLLNILEQTAPITVMAVATVFVLGSGEIDLSFASVVALAGLVTAIVLRDSGSIVLAVAAGLGVGFAVGLLNGLMVTALRLPSFLVTLGTMGLVAGLAQRVTNLESVPTLNATFNDVFGGGELLGVSMLIVWSAVAVAIGHYVFRQTRTGAHVLASGDNEIAAQVSGVKVGRVKTGALVASGMMAAFAGIMYTANLHGATYSIGSSDLLTVIAAVVIGGTRLFGGRGSVVGALFGSLILGVVNNGLILSGFTSSEQLIAQGAIILIAVALTLREPKR